MPSVFQRHMAYLRVVKSFLRCRFLDRKPFMLSHLITNRCNARCPFCPWRFPGGEELTLQEVENLYREASHLGFPLNFIWGGEPLLREDLTAAVRFSQMYGMSTSVFTNGYLLDQHHGFARYCDGLIVSLDAADSSHDAIRGVKNLFVHVVHGIDLVKRKYPAVEIFINCLLSRLNPGKIPGIMELAKEIGVTVFFSPVLYDDRFPYGETPGEIPDMTKPVDALKEDFLLIREYKERGYPVNNSRFSMDYFIEERRFYPCCWPFVCLTVHPQGGLEDCMTRTFFANVRHQTLREILRSTAFKKLQSRARTCRLACENLDSIEASGVWELRWDSIGTYHGVFRSEGAGRGSGSP